MRTPANIAGHPIHPMLVTIPIGLWIFSLVADLIALMSSAPQAWAAAAYYTMIGGIIGALAAALPGLIDLLSLKGRPIQKTALIHMSLNLTIVALYVVNAWLRYTGTAIGGTPLVLSLAAVAMLTVSGWLGGKMVYLAGVGVDTEQALQTATGGRRQERATGWTSDSAAADNGQPSMMGGRPRRGDVRGVQRGDPAAPPSELRKPREEHAFARERRTPGDETDEGSSRNR